MTATAVDSVLTFDGLFRDVISVSRLLSQIKAEFSLNTHEKMFS